jgi:hypothetical protein
MSLSSFRLTSLVALLVATWALAAAAQGGAPSPVNPDELALRQQYATFDRLLVDRNLDGVVALMTRDVTFQTRSGRRNLTQWKAAFDSQLQALVTTHTRVEAINLHGKSADVKTWCEQRYENLHVKGVPSTKFIIRSGAIDHWVKTDNGWRLKSSKQEAVDVEPLD